MVGFSPNNFWTENAFEVPLLNCAPSKEFSFVHKTLLKVFFWVPLWQKQSVFYRLFWCIQELSVLRSRVSVLHRCPFPMVHFVFRVTGSVSLQLGWGTPGLVWLFPVLCPGHCITSSCVLVHQWAAATREVFGKMYFWKRCETKLMDKLTLFLFELHESFCVYECQQFVASETGKMFDKNIVRNW